MTHNLSGKTNMLSLAWFRSSLAMALSLQMARLEQENEERLARERIEAELGQEPYVPTGTVDDPHRREAQIHIIDEPSTEGDVMKLLNLNAAFINPSLQKFSETPITWSPTTAERVARNNRVKGTKRRPWGHK